MIPNLKLEHILMFLEIYEKDLPIIGATDYAVPEFNMRGRAFFLIDKDPKYPLGWECIGFRMDQAKMRLSEVSRPIHFYKGSIKEKKDLGILTYTSLTEGEEEYIRRLLRSPGS